MKLLRDLKVSELKSELETRGLDTNGLKAELADRLQENLQEQNALKLLAIAHLHLERAYKLDTFSSYFSNDELSKLQASYIHVKSYWNCHHPAVIKLLKEGLGDDWANKI